MAHQENQDQVVSFNSVMPSKAPDKRIRRSGQGLVAVNRAC